MSETPTHDVTRLLRAWRDGDEEALERLAPIVEAELHRIAHRYMARERPGHALQTTALLNEAYIRLMGWKNADWQNRAHFFGVSARIMRRVLVDFARRRPHTKGLGDAKEIQLDETAEIPSDRTTDIVALDDALQSLEKLDSRKCRIVELRFFGGLSVEETAEVLGIAPITVKREWNKARAWLYGELKK